MWMPAPDEQTCRLVSRAIYRLTRPAGSDISDSTCYLFAWRQAADGSWWMRFDTETPLPVHPSRSSETADTLAAFVAAGSLSAESAQAIIALVQANVGGTLTLGQVTPPEWQAVMLTDAQAEALWPVPVDGAGLGDA